MPSKSPVRADHKRAAIAAIRRGELTVSEVASLLQVNKTSVSRWCRFDVDLARRKHMIRVWAKITGTKRETKEAQRRAAEVAKHFIDNGC